MGVTVVVGLQWGDEGKGKIVDAFAKDSDFVIRFHGGANAGHTVVNKFGKFPLHLVPAGIFNPAAKCLITNGAVVDPAVLRSEMAFLEKAGIRLRGRLFISPRAHVVTENMKEEDRKIEEKRGKNRIGTTGRGIGPTYAAKVHRTGLRVCDFAKTQSGSFLRPYVRETFLILRDALRQKKRILAEGAHGVLLDIDWGTYPCVTSSNVVPGALHAAAGIPPQEITRVIGVVKAYQTRVGAGPMPTELFGAAAETLRGRGNEYGTTTGRPRRCGWLDLEALKFACDLVRPTELVLTKLDVLDGLSEIPVAVGYRIGEKKISFAASSLEELNRTKPIYKILPGWGRTTVRVKKWSKAPKEARAYVAFIERFTAIPVRWVSVGPRQAEMLRVSS